MTALRLAGGLAALGADAQRILRSAGWAGVLGVALMVFALAFDISGNRPLADETDTLERQTRSLLRQQRRTVPPPPTERERLDAYYAAFPAGDGLADLLVRIHGYALARGLTADKADYRSTPLAGTPLEQVALELPLHGRYAALRLWLGDLLAELPEVAIDGLLLKRADIGAEELDARVRLVIFLRGRS
ncbi:MAG: hypothetical protein JSS57_25575 [Proteobacteria bacterium]|nr:hypothetical protein [Pseudomonadota bacterium]